MTAISQNCIANNSDALYVETKNVETFYIYEKLSGSCTAQVNGFIPAVMHLVEFNHNSNDICGDYEIRY